MLTRTVLSAAVIAGALISSAGVSSAMPMANPGIASSQVETVGWRCGPYRHMSRWGNCVVNRPVVYHRVAPRVRVWHRAYWAHHRWHPGYWSR